VALVGVALAAAGHGLGGSAVTVTPFLVLVAVLLAAACVLVSRTRWAAPRLLVALLGIQAAVHATLWFETGSHPVDSRLMGLSGAHGHEHLTAGGSSPAVMLAAHLVAAVAAALLLASLEGAVWLLVALARRILRPVAAVRIPALPRTASRAPRPSVVPALVLGAVGRRGPPVGLAPA
jgi:hypothetical protein